MDFVFLKLKVTNENGEEVYHPLFDGNNRISEDGQTFLIHKELLPKGYVIPKTSVMPTRLDGKGVEALCVMSDVQTKQLMETVAWSKSDIDISVEEEAIVEKVVSK